MISRSFVVPPLTWKERHDNYPPMLRKKVIASCYCQAFLEENCTAFAMSSFAQIQQVFCPDRFLRCLLGLSFLRFVAQAAWGQQIWKMPRWARRSARGSPRGTSPAPVAMPPAAPPVVWGAAPLWGPTVAASAAAEGEASVLLVRISRSFSWGV